MKSWNRSNWAGLAPNGVGQVKPNHYLEMAKVIWRNRDQLPFAWRILTRGVCDGCALGTAGVRDFTMDGVHLCMVRLELMRLNTGPALDVRRLADAGALARMTAAELRELGRLPYPMLRRRGDKGFARVTWDEALKIAASRADATRPQRMAFYLTSRGLTNEAYYVAQKVARFLGTNNVDNSARICHAPSTGALKRALGVAATTCSYKDVLGSDLVVLIGSDIANAQPVFMKYLYLARTRGTKVVVINPLREPGLERYWVPSNPESAVFGTRMTDEFYRVHTGGDTAFMSGALKALVEAGGFDAGFVRDHATGWGELVASLGRWSFDDLARASGSSIEDMRAFARTYAAASSAAFVWSMGVTQHVCGTENVLAIANLALARGNVGRPGTGLMPVRGHSGVQGGAEMGAYATTFPGGIPIAPDAARALERTYGFPVPSGPGLTVAEMLDAAGRGEMDVLYSSGGNFLDTLPDPRAEYRT